MSSLHFDTPQPKSDFLYQAEPTTTEPSTPSAGDDKIKRKVSATLVPESTQAAPAIAIDASKKSIKNLDEVRDFSVSSCARKGVDIAKSVLLFPVFIIVSLIQGTKIYFHRLNSSDTGIDASLCKQKVDAKNISLLATSEDSLAWKKALVENAKYSIEIAGYCGGKPFQEVLQIIERKLADNPAFKARVLVTDHVLSKGEKKHFDSMMKKYPQNFEVLTCPATFFSYGQTAVRHENHSKMVIADQKYCIMGGSSLNNQQLPHWQVKQAGGKCAFLSDGNSDIDIAAEGGIAETMKKQFDQLWMKWKTIGKIAKNEALDEGYTHISKDDKVDLPQFAENKFLDEISCSLILSVSEQGTENLNRQEYIKLIDKAKDTIEIANMSFNEKTILVALERAIKRGVKVRVITNGCGHHLSVASNILSPRGRRNYKRLMKAAAKSEKGGTFNIYEYQKKEILFHPKVLCIDKKTSVIGSFNLTHESAKCVDELTLVMESDVVATELLGVWDKFKDESKEITKEVTNTAAFKASIVKGKILDVVLKNIAD